MRTLRLCLVSASMTVVCGCSAGSDVVDHRRLAPSADRSASSSSLYGTVFDPCDAYGSEDLLSLGVSPEMKQSGNLVPGMSTRGCHWVTFGRSASQFILRSSSIDAYRDGQDLAVWRDEVPNTPRRIGVFVNEALGDCSTYVQSQQAGVITRLRADGDPDECPEVIEFTKRILHKIPE